MITEKAEEILRVEAGVRSIESLEQISAITALRQRFEDIRYKELEKSLGRNLKDLSEAQRAALQEMTTAMINKLLDVPISQLKRNSGDEDQDNALYVAALKKLFSLETEAIRLGTQRGTRAADQSTGGEEPIVQHNASPLAVVHPQFR